jgi:hypothetical protein
LQHSCVPRKKYIRKTMDISVVIPLYNEEESIGELFQWIERVMDEHHFSYGVNSQKGQGSTFYFEMKSPNTD